MSLKHIIEKLEEELKHVDPITRDRLQKAIDDLRKHCEDGPVVTPQGGGGPGEPDDPNGGP